MSVFAGNVYDADNNEIDCKFTLFHYNTNKQSDTRDTDTQQFSIDSDDSDVNDNGASFSKGDIAIFHFFTDDAFSVVKIISDGSDSYTFDVQLLPPQAPRCTIFVNNSTLNTKITASQTSSDEYQWDYADTTHYHKASWYGKDFCDIGIEKIEYDFGNGYDTKNTHTFDKVDKYEIKLRVTNKDNLQATDNKTITIYNNKPIIKLTNNPLNPKISEDFTVDISVDDVDEALNTNTYYIDDDETDTTTFSYDKIDTHIFRVTTKWDDGYDEREFNTTLFIQMKNEPPSVDLSIKNIKNKYLFDAQAYDYEDRLNRVVYNLYIDNSSIYETDKTFSFLESFTITDDDFTMALEFFNGGNFKVVAQAYDELDAKSELSELTFSVVGSGIVDEPTYKLIPVCLFEAEIKTQVAEANVIEEKIHVANITDSFEASYRDDFLEANFVEEF